MRLQNRFGVECIMHKVAPPDCSPSCDGHTASSIIRWCRAASTHLPDHHFQAAVCLGSVTALS